MSLLAQEPVVDWVVVLREHWIALAAAGGLLLAAWWLLRAIFARRRAAPDARPDLAVDVSVLPDAPPPPGPPVLEFYNIPVRLVAVVLAPVGYATELPAREELSEVVDSIVPGLDAVAAAHEPLIRAWPRQVSSRGFAHAFFQNLRLPGEPGKKGMWSSAAGMFRVGEQPMMAGLVLRAEIPNRHGNVIIENENQWLGVLRVRLTQYP